MTEVSRPLLKASQLGGKCHLLLFGFTVRALARAATEAHYSVSCLDHFGDQDLCEIALEHARANRWHPDSTSSKLKKRGASSAFGSEIEATDSEILSQLQALQENARKTLGAPTCPLLLAGGTENWTRLISKLHQRFQVFGANAGQLKWLRNPRNVAELALMAGVNFPSMIPAHASPRHFPPGIWLKKNAAGSGGTHVRRVQSMAASEHSQFACSQPASQVTGNPDSVRKVEYYQRLKHGRSLGATCILYSEPQSNSGGARSDARTNGLPTAPATGKSRKCQLVGVTESWSGEDWPGPSEFIYRGSWGPIQLDAFQERSIESLGRIIAEQTGLQGWLQMDFIEDSAGQLWLLEFNPRWTAGMEVLATCGRNPIPLHLASFGLQLHPLSNETVDPPTRRLGKAKANKGFAATMPLVEAAAKAILYADRDWDLSPETLQRVHRLPRTNFADLPTVPKDSRGRNSNLPVKRGSPLLTVLSRCASRPSDEKDRRSKLLSDLRARVEEVHEILNANRPAQ